MNRRQLYITWSDSGFGKQSHYLAENTACFVIWVDGDTAATPILSKA